MRELLLGDYWFRNIDVTEEPSVPCVCICAIYRFQAHRIGHCPSSFSDVEFHFPWIDFLDRLCHTSWIRL